MSTHASRFLALAGLLASGGAPAADFTLDPGPLADGVVRLTAHGAPGSHAVLQSSTDLTHWIDLETIALTTGASPLAAPPGESGLRAYRLRAALASEVPLPLAVRATPNGDFRRTVSVDHRTAGAISLTDDNGVIYELDLPAGCVLAPEDITLTVVNVIEDWPLAGTYLGGVRLEPDGVLLLAGATLKITVPAGTAPSSPGVAWRAAGSEFHAVPARVNGRTVLLPLERLGGYGVLAGAAGDDLVFTAHPPTALADQHAQEWALTMPASAGASPDSRTLSAHATKGAPAGLSPEALARHRQWYETRIRPRLADAAGDDAALEPALQTYSTWVLGLSLYLDAGDLAQLAPQTDEGNALAVAAIEACLARASRACDRHDLRSLSRMIRAGQLFEAAPWGSTVGAFEKNEFRQMVKNCATFDLALDATVDSTSKVGRQHSRVKSHWTIEFKDEALTDLTGSGPAPISEVDYQSTTVCSLTWSPAGGGVEIPSFTLGMNLRAAGPIAPPPSVADMVAMFNPFLAPPAENYRSICAGIEAPLGNYWAAAFGAAYVSDIRHTPRGQVLRAGDWTPGTDDLLGTRDTAANSLQGPGFTAKVDAHWELRHVPIPFH